MLGMKNHFDISGSIEICEVDIAGVACMSKLYVHNTLQRSIALGYWHVKSLYQYVTMIYKDNSAGDIKTNNKKDETEEEMSHDITKPTK